MTAPDRLDQVLSRLERIEAAQREEAKQLAVLTTRLLDERCPEHQRRIEQLERRHRDGSSGNGGMALTSRAVAALAGAITVLASVIATLISAVIGGGP